MPPPPQANKIRSFTSITQNKSIYKHYYQQHSVYWLVFSCCSGFAAFPLKNFKRFPVSGLASSPCLAPVHRIQDRNWSLRYRVKCSAVSNHPDKMTRRVFTTCVRRTTDQLNDKPSACSPPHVRVDRNAHARSSGPFSLF